MKKLLLPFIFSVSFAFTQDKSFHFYFDFNSSILTSKSEKEFSNFLKLSKNEKYEVSIETTTDTIGPVIYNEFLSKKRLTEISNRIQKEGFKIKYVNSRGEKNDNKTLSLNRQAEVKYQLIPSIKEEIVLQEAVVSEKFKNITTSKTAIEPIVLDIKFVPGEAVFLNDEAYEEANDLFEFLNGYKNVTALIRGHVCCKNDSTLSTQRAYTVYKYLLDKSIEPNRIDFKGFSNKLPVAFPEYTEVERQKNRRVDVIFKIDN